MSFQNDESLERFMLQSSIVSQGVPEQTHDEINKKRKITEVSNEDTSVTKEECIDDNKDPYVPMSIEEISVVKSLKHWTSPNVRVIGRFLPPDSIFYILQGVGEDHGDLCLNLENLDQYPKYGDIVEAFGKLQVKQSCFSKELEADTMSRIKLKVMFFRPRLDFFRYSKALSLMKPYIPLFVRRDYK